MMFSFGFDEGMDIDNYTFTIKLGNQIVQNQTIQAPSIIVKQNFIQLAEQIAGEQRPMQVKCTKSIYTDKDKPLEQFLLFANNLYINAFPDEFNSQ